MVLYIQALLPRAPENVTCVGFGILNARVEALVIYTHRHGSSGVRNTLTDSRYGDSRLGLAIDECHNRGSERDARSRILPLKLLR